MNNDSNIIILTAGGTGGHMFPASALAKDLVSRGYIVHLVTEERGAKYADIFYNVETHVIKTGTLGAGILGKIKGATKLLIGIIQARKIVKKLRPAVVVGFGGYPSVPAVHVAQRLRIPTILHEQNAIMGKANAFLAPKADRIALSLPNAKGLDETDIVRAVTTGNPVREEISVLYTKPYPVIQQDGIIRVFIMGGSLGAKVLADVIPSALSKLSASYRARLDITQQCREDDIEQAQETYKAAGIKARLETFFDDVPNILSECHLVISRSGASTVAEVAAAGRPAIFVPYPHHADQQQKINAESIADSGGAWVMTQNGFTEEALLARIETFLQTPEILFRAAESARSCGRPDAARRLGNLVTAIASGWDKKAAKPIDPTQGHE